MFDVHKQIEYWKETAFDNFKTAELLFENKKYLEALFFCHLTIEKLLKAYFVKSHDKLAPKTHQLLFLYSSCNLVIGQSEKEFLAEINDFNLEGRYPENLIESIEKFDAERLIVKTKEFSEWLTKQL